MRARVWGLCMASPCATGRVDAQSTAPSLAPQAEPQAVRQPEQTQEMEHQIRYSCAGLRQRPDGSSARAPEGLGCWPWGAFPRPGAPSPAQESLPPPGSQNGAQLWNSEGVRSWGGGPHDSHPGACGRAGREEAGRGWGASQSSGCWVSSWGTVGCFPAWRQGRPPPPQTPRPVPQSLGTGGAAHGHHSTRAPNPVWSLPPSECPLPPPRV